MTLPIYSEMVSSRMVLGPQCDGTGNLIRTTNIKWHLWSMEYAMLCSLAFTQFRPLLIQSYWPLTCFLVNIKCWGNVTSTFSILQPAQGSLSTSLFL